MRLNAANRAFLALVAISGLAAAALGTAAISLLTLIVYQTIVAHGRSGVLQGHDLRPALAFLLIVGVGTVLGLRSLRKQISATRRLRSRIDEARVQTAPEIVVAASRRGIDRRRIDVVSSPDAFSFAYGFVLPRIVVSEGLISATAPDELEAVLEHERYHVRNLDPLKVLLARVLPAAFFFFPALHDLRRRYVAGRELAADRRAVAKHGRKALAGALLKVAQGPDWAQLAPAAAIGGSDLLDVRVAQLETGSEPEMRGVSKLAAFGSTLGLAFLAWSFAWAVADIGGPVAHVLVTVPRVGLQAATAPLALLGAAARVAFWVWIGWLIYRALGRRRRHSLPLDS